MAQPKHSPQTISWFWDHYQRELLDLDPPYQRRSVWNQSYREYFIDTLLLDYPAPAIFLYQEIEHTGKTKYYVVDGKQRLVTIFDFVRDMFPVGERAELTSARGKYFSQLDRETKVRLWGYQFIVEYLPTSDEKVINSIFDRINRNVAKLTAQELRHAKFDGEFISSAESLAAWLTKQLPDFPRITQTSRNQMKDVEFVAYLLLLLEEGPKGYGIVELDKAFSDRDNSWDQRQDIEDQFRKTVATLMQMTSQPDGSFIRSSRLRNQADFYSLFGAIAALSNRSALPDINTTNSNLAAFLKIVDSEDLRTQNKDALAYYEAARSASNDAGPRKARIEIMQKAILGQLTL